MLLGGERHPGVDPLAHDAARSTGRAGARPSSARASASSAVDQPRQPRHLVERALELALARCATSRSRFSSRSRRAVSGVRSWCDASATNASCERSSSSSGRHVVEAPPRASAPPAALRRSRARAVRSPAASCRGGLLQSRSGSRPTGRARSPTGAATASDDDRDRGEDQPVAPDALVDRRRRIGDPHGAVTRAAGGDRHGDVEQVVPSVSRVARAASRPAPTSAARSRAATRSPRPGRRRFGVDEGDARGVDDHDPATGLAPRSARRSPAAARCDRTRRLERVLARATRRPRVALDLRRRASRRSLRAYVIAERDSSTDEHEQRSRSGS